MQQRQIIFICHRLGVMLLKKALCAARRSSNVVNEVTAGIIFLGTPHLQLVDDSRWDNWKWILKIFCRDLPKECLTSSDIVNHSETCRSFTLLNPQFPILSVYDVKEMNLTSGSNSKTLVDKSHATTRGDNEELFEAESTDQDLCLVVSDTALNHQLVKFFKAAMEDALPAVAALHVGDSSAPKTRSSFGSVEDAREPVIFTPTSFFQMKCTNTNDGEIRTHSDRSPNTISEFNAPRRATNVPLHMLKHQRNPRFVGQNDALGQMDRSLPPRSDQAVQRQPRSFVLCGLGGIGKNETAIEYTFSRKSHFDTIFWVNEDTTQKIAAGSSEIAQKFGLEDSTSNNDPVATREIVNVWMANPLIQPSDECTTPVREAF
ncbi:hypothetical protein ONS96_007142 [Cadophora gregata f. sp. sojae]|nr:hypothetical protein ONS96_007142 [Cadophora gregata f. sp. sojae]